ncbi:MAG: zinc-ribbon domain containing protein [Candidatus Paceibacterota bacterium]
MQKICQNCKAEFKITDEDQNFYRKIKVPHPTFCPSCRLARKLAWRNERNLYKRTCDLCKKNIISMHKIEALFPVYCHDCWWSDEWDPLEYGQEIDFSKNFFEQYKELQKNIPRPSAYSTANINSEYCNHSAHMKDSYWIFGSWFSENCGYGHTLMNSKDCWDCIFMRKNNFCFFSSDCADCNQLFFSRQCSSCIDSYFIYDCRNCQNCIFSYNLRNKNYYIFNKPVSKDEFEKTKKEILCSRDSLEKAKNIFEKLIEEKAIHKFMTGERNKDVSGEFISNSKNVHNSYYIDNGENEKYAVRGGIGQKDTMDAYGTHAGELCYETNNIDFSSRCFFSINGESNINSNYLIDCDHLNNSFGCISVRKNEYCILNKKYSKEEYEEILPKLLELMYKIPYIDNRGIIYKYGEFFPAEFSPFYYNETIAQEYFQLDEQKSKKLGFLWDNNTEEKSYNPTINWKDLPQKIKETNSSILSEIILCETWDKDKEEAKKHKCTKAFKIIPNELTMYKKYGLPLPTKCPNTRYFEASSKRNSINFFHRKCMKEGCLNEFETSYSPDRPEIVYCESCYQQEIY